MDSESCDDFLSNGSCGEDCPAAIAPVIEEYCEGNKGGGGGGGGGGDGGFVWRSAGGLCARSGNIGDDDNFERGLDDQPSKEACLVACFDATDGDALITVSFGEWGE